MKHCRGCGLDKPLNQFQKDRSRPDGLQGLCKSCVQTRDRARHAEYRRLHPLPGRLTREELKARLKEQQHSWYERNRSTHYANVTQRRIEAAALAWAFKEAAGCARCPERRPQCLEFHHRDPAMKACDVSWMVYRGYGRDRILREIDKCEILCANCHADVEWRARQPACHNQDARL